MGLIFNCNIILQILVLTVLPELYAVTNLNAQQHVLLENIIGNIVENKIQTLNKAVELLNVENEEQRALIKALKFTVDEQQQHIEDLQTHVDSLQDKNVLGEQSNIAHASKQSSTWPVIFSVRLRTHFLGAGVIPFTEDITNVGSHYNTTTHRFTCPISAYYFFTFSLWSNELKGQGKNETVAGMLYVGETKIAQAFGQIYSPLVPDRRQVANTAIVYCEAGEQAYISSAYFNATCYGDGFGQSIFSGFMFRPELS